MSAGRASAWFPDEMITGLGRRRRGSGLWTGIDWHKQTSADIDRHEQAAAKRPPSQTEVPTDRPRFRSVFSEHCSRIARLRAACQKPAPLPYQPLSNERMEATGRHQAGLRDRRQLRAVSTVFRPHRCATQRPAHCPEERLLQIVKPPELKAVIFLSCVKPQADHWTLHAGLWTSASICPGLPARPAVRTVQSPRSQSPAERAH